MKLAVHGVILGGSTAFPSEHIVLGLRQVLLLLEAQRDHEEATGPSRRDTLPHRGVSELRVTVTQRLTSRGDWTERRNGPRKLWPGIDASVGPEDRVYPLAFGHPEVGCSWCRIRAGHRGGGSPCRVFDFGTSMHLPRPCPWSTWSCLDLCVPPQIRAKSVIPWPLANFAHSPDSPNRFRGPGLR